jgi:type VI secretion system VasD/TssJ family lipoprotein
MLRAKHIKIAMALAASCAFAGCGQADRVALRAIEPVNVNPQGESLPVQVRIYELADDKRFLNAAFTALWLDDKAVLGEDRQAQPRTVIVRPGQVGAPPQELGLGTLSGYTHYIGIMALYPEAGENDARRAVIPLTEVGDKVIELTGTSVTVRDR